MSVESEGLVYLGIPQPRGHVPLGLYFLENPARPVGHMRAFAKAQGVRAEVQPGQCSDSQGGISGCEKHVVLRDPEWGGCGHGATASKITKL